MKKSVSFVWDDAYQKAFEDIKVYLTKPHILASPVLGKLFLLYIRVMDHSLGALLAQKNDEGAEKAIYYLSRIMIGEESHYNPVKKECLALVFAIQKMQHYLVRQTIHVISRVNPLRILMTRPTFTIANVGKQRKKSWGEKLQLILKKIKLQAELSSEISGKVCRWESNQRAITLSYRWCDRSVFECYCLRIPSHLVPKIPWKGEKI